MKTICNNYNMLIITIVMSAFVASHHASEVDGAIITSASYVFETFSPYAMIRFFEFSDKGWNISENCLKDMYNYLEGLRKGSHWAIKLYDATSYYSGGSFAGNKIRINNPDLCRKLEAEYKDMLHMHWNLRLNTTVVPFPVHLVVAKYRLEMAKNYHEVLKIQQSVCFPKACNYQDLMQIMDIYLFQSNHIIQNMTLMDVRLVREDYSILDDGNFYILIVLILAILIPFMCSYFSQWTVVEPIEESESDFWEKDSVDTKTPSSGNDLNNNSENYIIEQLSKLGNMDKESVKLKMNPLAKAINTTEAQAGSVKIMKLKSKSHAAFDMSVHFKTRKVNNLEKKGSLMKDLFNAFSLRSILSEMEIERKADEAAAVLNGFQVFCSFSMIFANTYAIMSFVSNNPSVLTNEPTMSTLVFFKNQSTYLIDLFFFFSGANLTKLYFKMSLRSSWNVFEQLFHFVVMIGSKICSIALPYTIVLLCLDMLSKHYHFNTTLEIPSFDYQNCDQNKWRNVLYIDSFFPLQERCMPWTWFMSLEVNFYFAACIILLLAQIHPKYAGVIGSTLFLTSIVASTVLEMDSPAFEFNEKNLMDKDIMEFNLIFEKIWLRISPYLLGMCLGYILHKTKGKFNMNVVIVVFGWIACFMILAGFVFGFQPILFRVNLWIRAAIITLSHTIWSMILFWIALASISQYGGFLRRILTCKQFYILGKLSNCIFLVNPLLIRTIFLSVETGVHMSFGHFLGMFIGVAVMSYCVAFVMHTMFVAPLMSVLKIIYDRHHLK